MLTDDQKQFFNANGYVLVQGLLSPDEAAGYREECHTLATRLADIRGIEDPTWGSAGTRGVTQLRHCHPAGLHSFATATMCNSSPPSLPNYFWMTASRAAPQTVSAAQMSSSITAKCS